VITGFTKTFSDIISRLIELDPVFYRGMKFLLGQKIAGDTDRSPLALQMARSNVRQVTTHYSKVLCIASFSFLLQQECKTF